MLQAATIAAKDVSALRKASGSNQCKKMLLNGAFKLVARAVRRRTRALHRLRRRHRDAVAATHKNTQHETQAPA